jgi:hypothetical protein
MKRIIATTQNLEQALGQAQILRNMKPVHYQLFPVMCERAEVLLWGDPRKCREWTNSRLCCLRYLNQHLLSSKKLTISSLR